MSKLERLMAELCPGGEEYKMLGDTAYYSSIRISASEVNSENYVGVDNLFADKRGKGLSDYVPASCY